MLTSQITGERTKNKLKAQWNLEKKRSFVIQRKIKKLTIKTENWKHKDNAK
jgi:hypothetical protein